MPPSLPAGCPPALCLGKAGGGIGPWWQLQVAGTKGTAWGWGRDQESGSHLGQAGGGGQRAPGDLLPHQHPQTLLLGMGWEGTVPRGTPHTPLGDATGRHQGPVGQGLAVGAYPGGGVGVKAISTLILSSFLCRPKPLTAPKPSPAVPAVGGRRGTPGTGSPVCPHQPWGSPRCGAALGDRRRRGDDGTGGRKTDWGSRVEQEGEHLWSPHGAHHRGIRPAVCPTLVSSKVSPHPFPGAGESGKSTIVKQMK